MKAVLSIANREFKSFFGTPLGWIASCIIFLIAGIVFFIVITGLLNRGQSVDPVADIFGQILGFLNYINIFIIPAFTMRVMSEDFNIGTYRLQASSPISTWDVILGKFLGVMYFFGVVGVLMFIYPLYTVLFADPDLKTLASGWLGMMLNVSAIVAIGLFIGSLTKNPVISYLGSAFFIILFIFSGFIPGVPDWYKSNVNILALGEDFARGLIKTPSIGTFLAIVLSFLFLSRFVLESKRWRV